MGAVVKKSHKNPHSNPYYNPYDDLTYRGGVNGGDGPTVTYATWNPADRDTLILVVAPDNLIAYKDSGAGHRMVRGTIAMTSGKWFFWNQLAGATNTISIGVANASASLTSFLGSDVHGFGYYAANGNKINSGSLTAYGAAVAAGDYMGIGFDADARQMEGFIYSGGEWVSQGVIDISAVVGDLYPAVSLYAGNPAYPTATGDIIESSFGQNAGPAETPTGYQTGVFV